MTAAFSVIGVGNSDNVLVDDHRVAVEKANSCCVKVPKASETIVTNAPHKASHLDLFIYQHL